MSEEFKIEIVNPERSFLSKKDVTEVVIPAFEGEMGILKDHISIISFLKPGIIKIFSKNNEEKFYVEDGIVEFKDNSLSILTSSIFGLDKIDKDYVSQSIQNAEKELLDKNVEDQKRFLISQKIDVLKSISSN
jgi:ATP synthase F1 epsilon subunit|tara:strand:- start:333 stop:731 length:399 start_codon:yes stop_codon:yes gene_type:complete